VAGVAGKGETLDIVPRYLITGRRVCGSSFGGVKGREQVPSGA
jgi:S-(hydroxymethyl)glutathione dehydrogenase / alcohol dehydrogenase